MKFGELNNRDFFEQILNDADPGRKDRRELLRPASNPVQELLKPVAHNVESRQQEYELLRGSSKSNSS